MQDSMAARAFSDTLRGACPHGRANVIFDPIGGPYSEPAFRTLGWQGRHLVVGFTAGISRLPLNLPLLKGSRSEEHTSELQSLMRISYAVFCLNKKTNKT